MPNSNIFPGFVIENTTISVDFWPKTGYSFLTHSFLSHAHSDHTKNLDSAWNNQLIYCSAMTKKLLIDLKGVNERFIVSLGLNRTHIMRLDDNESFNVTLIDANHCPGAVMFLFEGYFGRVVATGDFRYTPSMFIDSPLLNEKAIEICYLDNTYLHKSFENIPTRDQALSEIIKHIESLRLLRPSEIHVFNIKLRLLGKEELIVNLYKHFKVPIVCAEPRYNRYTKVLNLESNMLQTEPDEGSFIFLEDDDLYEKESILDFQNGKIVNTVEPTALYLNQQRNLSDKYFKIAYTDHSSYSEIHEFVKLIKPKKIVPIVRQELPNNIDTSDISSLLKYQNKEPRLSVNDSYRLLLQSSSSVKGGSHLNSFKLNQISKKTNRVDTPSLKGFTDSESGNPISSTPINRRQSTPRDNSTPRACKAFNNVTRRRRSSAKTEIQYETSPEKENNISMNSPQKIEPIKKSSKLPGIYKIKTIKSDMEVISEENNNALRDKVNSVNASNKMYDQDDRAALASDDEIHSEKSETTLLKTNFIKQKISDSYTESNLEENNLTSTIDSQKRNILGDAATNVDSKDVRNKETSQSDHGTRLETSQIEIQTTQANSSDISSSNDYSSFRAYEMSILQANKSSKWRRLSDQVEILRNETSSDESVSSTSTLEAASLSMDKPKKMEKDNLDDSVVTDEKSEKKTQEATDDDEESEKNFINRSNNNGESDKKSLDTCSKSSNESECQENVNNAPGVKNEAREVTIDSENSSSGGYDSDRSVKSILINQTLSSCEKVTSQEKDSDSELEINDIQSKSVGRESCSPESDSSEFLEFMRSAFKRFDSKFEQEKSRETVYDYVVHSFDF